MSSSADGVRLPEDAWTQEVMVAGQRLYAKDLVEHASATTQGMQRWLVWVYRRLATREMGYLDALRKLAEVEAENARLRAEAKKEERACLQLIDERDDAEESLGRAFTAVTGREAEWSSAWGYPDAIEEMGDEVESLRRRITSAEAAIARIIVAAADASVTDDEDEALGMSVAANIVEASLLDPRAESALTPTPSGPIEEEGTR